MRKIFNDEELWNKTKRGELVITWGKIRQRNHPTETTLAAPFSQEFVISDPASLDEVARCQWFLEADQTTVAASGKPDPKQIVLGGIDYHLTGNKAKCEHCTHGITTYSEKPFAP